MKILIVDDDTKLCRLVADYLQPMGYETDMAHDGEAGLTLLRSGEYKAVILDFMMPGMDGLEVLRQVRKEGMDISVLMLTARADETDRIVGLEMGADDYLPKTFSPRELLARLRAVTRRYQAAADRSSSGGDRELVCGPLEIRPASRTVLLDGTELVLTPLEFDLLTALARSAGRVLSREQLMDGVAGRNYEVFDRSVDVHVSSLRRKLGEDPRAPQFIKTVRKVGYMFLKPGDSA